MIAVVARMRLDGIGDQIELDEGPGMGFEHLVAVVEACRGVEAETVTFLCKANAAVLGEVQLAVASPAGSDFVCRGTGLAVGVERCQSVRRVFD